LKYEVDNGEEGFERVRVVRRMLGKLKMLKVLQGIKVVGGERKRYSIREVGGHLKYKIKITRQTHVLTCCPSKNNLNRRKEKYEE